MRYQLGRLAAACIGVLSLLEAATIPADERTPTDSFNGCVQISSRLINMFLERPVADQRTVQETILGATTTGAVNTQGNVTAYTIPDLAQGMIQVQLQGTAQIANGVAERRAVTVYSSANTSINAVKRIG